MIIRLICLWVLSIMSLSAYAEGGCASDNPYSQQTCERLQRSAQADQKAKADDYQKALAQNQQDAQDRIQNEQNPHKNKVDNQLNNSDNGISSPGTPAWQKALNHDNDRSKDSDQIDQSENSTATQPTVSNGTTDTSSGDGSGLTPLPPAEPTQFSQPDPVTLPGGVKMIPVKPQKGSGEGGITYY